MASSPLRFVPDDTTKSRMLVADQLSAAEREQAQNGADSQLERGLRAGAAGMSAGAFDREALAGELSGDPNWQQKRAVAHQMGELAGEVGPRVSSLRDVHGVGDAADWAAGAFGQGLVSMAPVVAAAFASRVPGARGLLAKALPYATAAVPAYMLERGEAVHGQYEDPALAAATAQDRDRVATYKGLVNAGLEAAVPAGLANSFLRKPATSLLGTLGRRALEEGATEGAQEYVGYRAEKALDPNRQLDPWRIVDATAMGALTGGGVSAATSTPGHLANAALGRQQARQDDAGGPPEALGGPTPPPAPVDPDMPPPAPEGLGSRASELYENLSERFAPKAQEAYDKASDYVSDVVNRMNEAIKTAENPQDFLRQVFRPSSEELAQQDLAHETEDPTVLNAPDPAAALLDRGTRLQRNAASFAQELLDDPATPGMIKDRIAAMGGDFSSPSNQAYIAANLLAVKGGQKVVDAVDSIVEFSKSFVDKAKNVASDAKDRVSKKNLQDINEADIAPLVSVLAQRLGPVEAGRAPKLAKQLIAAANRLSPDAKINAETERRLRNLSEAIDDETLDMVTELSGSDALRNSIVKIRSIPSAISDVRQSGGQSFLESMLKQPFEPAMLGQLSKFVDTVGLQLAGMPAARKNQVLGGLAAAFGSKREAQTVVEYYGNIKREAFRREAEAGKLHEDREGDDMSPGEVVATLENPDGTVSYGEEFGSLTERDAAEMTASYRDPNPARPFFRGTDRAALRAARRAAPAGSRVASLREYVAQTDEAPQAVAARVRQDLHKRLTDAENRDTATVQEAIASMEAIPEAERSEDFNQLLSQLKARKTENRTDLPGLRKQMAAIEKASGVSFKEIADLNRRIRRAELADEGGIENDDIAKLPALRKQLSKLEDRYSKNAEKVLEKYAVVMRPKDETFANDELVAKFRGILDKLPNANVGTPAQRAEAKDKIAKIKKTAIKFNRKGGKTPITLSAESMAYASQARGSMEERFFDSLAAVLARPDIEGLVPPAPDTLISRKTGLTWGDIVPEKIEDNRTERQKKAQRDKDTTAAWAKQEQLRDDIKTWPKLMAALRDVQRRFLADRLGLTIAPDETISLADLIDRFPPSVRRAMRTDANEAAFQTALGWAKKLSRKLAGATERNYADESRMRVLEKYIDEQLDDRFPVPEGDERASRRIAAEEQAAGMREDKGSIGGAILDAEAELDMLEERLDAVQGIDGLTRKYERQVEEAETELNRLVDSVGSPEQRTATVPGRRAESGEGSGTPVPNIDDERALAALRGRLATLEGRRADAIAADAKTAAIGGVAATDVQTAVQLLEEQIQSVKDSIKRYEERPARPAPTAETGKVNPHPTRGNLRPAKRRVPGAYMPNEDTSLEDSTERVILPQTSPYTAKDQAKSDKATQFIGRGSARSSTAAYAAAWGDRANTGVYSNKDVVFVSAEGNRAGRITPDWRLIKAAADAGATFITDKASDRARPYNVGERSVAEALQRLGYEESAPGTWTPGDAARGAEERSGQRIRKNSFVGVKADPEGAAKASEALDSGASAKLVWAMHGWFRGPDGMMRKELRSPVLRARVHEFAKNLLGQRLGAAEADFEGVSADQLFDGVPGYEKLLKTLSKYTIGLEDDPEIGMQGMVGVVAGNTLTMSVDGAGLQAVLRKYTADELTTVIDKGVLDPTDMFSSARDAVRGGYLPKFESVEAFEREVLTGLEKSIHHELQHILQGAEGFENGGNPTTAIVSKYGDISVLEEALRKDDLSAAMAEIERARSAMLADIGPDADPETVAHDLYRDIVGEVEAHDVEARFNLSDAEAKRILPEMMNPNREFLRGIKVAIDAAKLVSKQNRQTTNDDGSFDEPDFSGEEFPKRPKERDWKGRTNDDGSFDEPDFGDPDFGPEQRDWKGRTDDDGSFDEPDWDRNDPQLEREEQDWTGRTDDDGSFDEPLWQNRQTTIGDKRKPPNAKEHAELKKKLIDEIRRIRGNDVRVRFNRLIKHIGASGEFSMNPDKTDRLIEVAVNAADPVGVAWHESLHDFFAMLGEDKVGRSIKRDLIQAASAPHVKKRLRELLEGHPKAREQIEKSPEERVAYMYQFWAAGELQLGPTGTGIFEKLRQFFRDLLHVVGRDERAADLLTALHEGKFADPSVVAEVLADMPRDRVFNRLERTAPALTDTLQKLMQVAPDRLRAYQNDALNKLADMFSSEKGELGFVQRRYRRDGEWTNKLFDILAGTKAVERRKALDNLQAMRAPSSKLEQDLAKFFEDMHGYMLEADVQTLDSKTKKWVPIRQVKNYFPRVFDREAIMKDRDGFKNLLMQHGNMTAKAAENTINALTHGTGQLDLAENEHALGFTPYAKAVQDRQLTFINPSNAAEFAKYQSKDLADITTVYVKQAVHRAEYARMFGNRGEKISQILLDSGITDKKELADIEKTVQGLEGTLGYEMSAQTKELMSGVMTLQNLVILPVAIFSQMVDPVVLAARSGDLRDAGNAYMTAIRRLAGKDVDGEDLAEMLGIVSQETVLDAMGVAYGTTHMSKRMRNINRVFFKYNGMQGWNNSMRIAATAAGERYLLQNRNNKEALAELGLEPSDIKTVASYRGVKPDANNKVVLRDRLDVSNPKVKEAMFRFVDQAVLRPSASNRPVWMSDPKFLLLAHLKQFTFAMHNVVLKRASQQLDEGNPKPWAILMLAMPTILAADMAKFALTGGPPPGWGFKEFLAHAVERSGLLGLGDFGAQAMKGVEQGRVPGEALLGPSFEHLMDLLRFLGGSPTVSSGDVIDRSVPGARFF